jgi:hypothetical protein
VVLEDQIVLEKQVMLHVKPEALSNDPCPCGSGKKYKRCCGTLDAVQARHRRRQMRRIAKGSAIALVVVIIISSGAVLAGLRQPRQVAPPPPRPPIDRAQPGPAPEGKVWSEEHGHWHDLPPAGLPESEGRVWSEEHGHWHDAEGGELSRE